MRRLAQRVLPYLLVISLMSSGCSRNHYLRQSDEEVYALLDQKAERLHVGPHDYSVDPPPQSRLNHPWSLTEPPRPPDDPISHELMLHVDHKKGWRHWDKYGVLTCVENAEWFPALLAMTEQNEYGAIVVDLPTAVKIARLNNRDFQDNLETLYLSALDVTFERFRFDTQFFMSTATDYVLNGEIRGGGESTSSLGVSNSISAQRLFTTGGQLVVDLANSIVWQFSGPDTYTAVTLLDFTFFQPLLREAGKPRVLERLTLAERILVANVRAFERYQRGFYLEIAAGTSSAGGPSRRGGVFGGAGLSGFSGVGGGFGSLGGGGGGGGFAGGAGAGQADGFLGRLQDIQQIRNQEANLVALRESLAQLEAAYAAGRIDIFQVEQARQAVYNAESQLLSARAALETELDQFKLDLGLPPEIPLALEDSFLKPFQLLDVELTALQSEITDALEVLRSDMPVDPEVVDRVAARVNALADRTEDQIQEAAEDYEQLAEAVPRRRQGLIELAASEEVRAGQIDSRLVNVELFDARVERLREDLGSVSEFLRVAVEEVATMAEAWAENPTQERRVALTEALSSFNTGLLELSLIQARARLDRISLQPVNMTETEAIYIAAAYRRDWANARASLVDTWRLIEFNANALRSDLNLTVSGDISNTGDRLFNLNGATGQLRLGLQWDAPLTRVAERNVFRQSILDYQEARRNYMEFTDGVKLSLRATLRQLRRDNLNFELRRSAIDLAIRQVDVTQLRLNAPPRPEAEGGGQFGGTTARDLLDALSDLLSVQNDFLSVYVNYQVQRMVLDRDLGTMQIDPYGIWIDPGEFNYDVPCGTETCLLFIPGDGEVRDELIRGEESIFDEAIIEDIEPPIRAAPLPELEGPMMEPEPMPETPGATAVTPNVEPILVPIMD